MADRCRDARLAGVVEGYHAAVAQGQLQLALTLLAGDLAGHRAVNLVGQPVLAGHSLERQHILDILEEVGSVILRLLVDHVDGGVGHHGLGGVAKHVGHLQVDGLHPLAVGEYKTVVARGLADNIHRGALALGDTLHIGDVLGLDDEAHTLLTLVADNLLGRKGRVADREGIDVDAAAGGLDKLGEGVEMTAGTVVMD